MTDRDLIFRRTLEKYPPFTFLPGPDGVRRLAEAVDAHARRATTEDEDTAFVEFAGAWLALLLVHHDPLGHHAEKNGLHRVRLGAFGTFDPFACIDDALKSDRPKASLASGLREAELEQRGSGKFSSIVTTFVNSLDILRPDLKVTRVFEYTIELHDSTEVSLERLATFIGDTSGLDDAARKLVEAIPRKEGDAAFEIGWSDAKGRLFPRLVSKSFGDEGQVGVGLALEPWHADVQLALVLQFDKRSKFVRRCDLVDWKASFGDAVAVSIQNLAARTVDPRLLADGDIYMVRKGDGLDAARILLPDFRKAVVMKLGRDCRFAIPHRDALLLSAASEQTALRRRVQEDFRKAPHAITDSVFAADELG